MSAEDLVEMVSIMETDIKFDGHIVESKQEKPYKMKIIWPNVGVFTILHLLAFQGVYLAFTSMKIITIIYSYIYMMFSCVGITGGAHRLWSHRSYKAKVPMRILLMLMQSAAHQNSIHQWVRDHRCHHKYTDTDADPHNSNKGFFFSHMGWLIVKKHPEVLKHRCRIDMSDIDNDPVVSFQRKHFFIIMPIMCFIVPTLIPMYLWGETFKNAFFAMALRYTIALHSTWLVNSAAHMYGYKPYEKSISPVENMTVAVMAFGEGWHNYHHVFPWDYKAAELGNYKYNITTAFIDFFAALGLAYDLKTASTEMIKKRIDRTGDGTWKNEKSASKIISNESEYCRKSDRVDVWGWDDKDMKPEDVEGTEII